jgi:hypothetical protein
MTVCLVCGQCSIVSHEQHRQQQLLLTAVGVSYLQLSHGVQVLPAATSPPAAGTTRPSLLQIYLVTG